MALIDDVKLALRISHTKLDSEIAAYIESAKKDMIRAGAPEPIITAAIEQNIVTAIKTYVLARMTDIQTVAEKYQASYDYQLDNIRKSTFELPPDPDDGTEG